MEAQKDVNEIILRGRAGEEPAFSHINHGESFYLMPMIVTRLSGTDDRLNIQLPGKLLETFQPKAGDTLEVAGSLRTFNNRSGVGSRLVITVLAHAVGPTREPPANLLTLAGTVCRRNDVRRTPLGREICDFTLAVNRRYGRADYLPCIAWGTVAQQCAALPIGSRIALDGRLQSRRYVKQLGDREEDRVAYEVSAMEVKVQAP